MDPLQAALQTFDQADRKRIVDDGGKQLERYRGVGTLNDVADLPKFKLPDGQQVANLPAPAKPLPGAGGGGAAGAAADALYDRLARQFEQELDRALVAQHVKFGALLDDKLRDLCDRLVGELNQVIARDLGERLAASQGEILASIARGAELAREAGKESV